MNCSVSKGFTSGSVGAGHQEAYVQEHISKQTLSASGSFLVCQNWDSHVFPPFLVKVLCSFHCVLALMALGWTELVWFL